MHYSNGIKGTINNPNMTPDGEHDGGNGWQCLDAIYVCVIWFLFAFYIDFEYSVQIPEIINDVE